MAQFPVKRIQHRPRRDGRRARELADLKRERHHLVEETDRLAQALQKAARPRRTRSPKAPEPTKADERCPQCGTATRLVNLGRMTLRACPNCKWHAKVEE